MKRVSHDFVHLDEGQRRIQRNVRDRCEQFDVEYWRRCDQEEQYPLEFVDALADDGILGMLVPEAYGGAGLSLSEAVVVMEEIAASGGLAAAQAILGAVLNADLLVRCGTEERRDELLPEVATGDTRIQSFFLTEPDSGSDPTAIETVAVEQGETYLVSGRKVWASRIEASDYVVIVARTTPRSAVADPRKGLSLFLVDRARLDDPAVDVEGIPKSATNAVPSYRVAFDGLEIPASNLLGEEGEGFSQLLGGLNTERIVFAAECVGLCRIALDAAVAYAGDRTVFGRAIGRNQAIQHPLAAAYVSLFAAKHLTYAVAERMATLDSREAGAEAAAAKYFASEAAYRSADAAVQTFGGFGVARECDVERYFREARLTRLYPISQELVLNYLGEHVLGLPKSY